VKIALKFLLAGITLLMLSALHGGAQTRVQDIFGRSLNTHGITLMDWDGYMANPLIKFYLLPPTNAVPPGSATLTADGARLYFGGTGSGVSTNGPSTIIALTSSNTPVPVNLSIFPAHNDPDGNYTLTIIFTDANNAKQTNTLPILVIDEDTHQTNAFVVTANFDRDTKSFFTNVTAQALVTQAANDWAYYFTGMNLDPVAAGTEATWIWRDNLASRYLVTNTNNYTGYLLYAYGITNSTHTSGGEASGKGHVQTSGGLSLTMKRSGSFDVAIEGNYNTLGWLFLTNDNDWLVSGNKLRQTNDFYSIAHHEIGHALIFHQANPGFATARNNGAFTSAAVTNYYGKPVAIDTSVDHLTNAIDPESGQGAFGNEYYGNIPRNRWTMTKLDLLCAQEVGYVLKPLSAFAPFIFATNALPAANTTIPFTFTFVSTGGIPIYDWDIITGTLPPGLALDTFSGTLAGTPATNGVFNFTVRVRDYHESGSGLTQNVTLNITSPPPIQLAISGRTDDQLQISFLGIPGQQQIIEASSNLMDWIPIATNTFATNFFQLTITNILQSPGQFYRSAIIIP